MKDIRPFDYDKDLDAVKRLWREVGWVDADSEPALDYFFKAGRTLVGLMQASVECSVNVVDGSILLGEQTLGLCAVTAVTTSRIARGRSFAQNITAKQLSDAISNGAAVAALGMFDQGFYDKLGFGTGAYEHEFSIDPNRTPILLYLST